MLVALFVNLFAVLFAFLEGKKILRNGMFFSFFIIFIFLALRYDFGNDYAMYIEGFEKINSTQYIDIFSEDIHYEPGWVILCMFFKPIGFFGMVAVLSLLYCVVFYKLIADNVPIHLYWLATFIFVFNTGFLLVHLSAMRQTLVIVLFIYAIQFIYKKQLLFYCIIIVLASTFHTSAIVLLPFYFLNYINNKISKIFIIIFLGIYILLYIIGQQLRPFINLIVASLREEYLIYDDQGELNSGIGLIITSFFFFLVLDQDKNFSDKKALYFKLAIVSFVLSPLGMVLLLIGRIQMYFSVFLIVVYPLVYDSIKSNVIRYVFLIFLILLHIVTFFSFFDSPIWIDKFKEYHTIFFAN